MVKRRMNVEIDEETYERLKEECKKNGVHVKDKVTQLICDELDGVLVEDDPSPEPEPAPIDMEALKEEVKKSVKDALDAQPVEAPAPILTKEEIITHLQTCTDPNCQYGIIAEAAKELDRRKGYDETMGMAYMKSYVAARKDLPYQCVSCGVIFAERDADGKRIRACPNCGSTKGRAL